MGKRAEGDREQREGDPAGLRVESAEGDFGITEVADDDQAGDSKHVERPRKREARGEQEERRRETIFLAKPREPGEGEDEEETHPFVTRTGGQDLHRESLCPDDFGCGKDMESETAEDQLRTLYGYCPTAIPKAPEEAEDHHAGHGQRAPQEQGRP